MEPHLKEIQSQVDAMNKSFGMNPGDSTESPETDPPSTEAPGTESPGTEAPDTESPETESPETEVPGTEAPTTEVPDERDVELERLRKENEELRKKKEKEPKTEAPTTEVPLSLEDIDFLGDLDFEELIRDPKELNKFLNEFRGKTLNEARKIISERVLRSIPDIVKNNVALTVALKKLSDEFYDNNKDLKPFKKVVSTVFEELQAKNPDKTYEEIMKDTGPEVRKRLELQKAAPKPKPKPGAPRLPKKKGRAGGPGDKPKLEGIDKEISEMNTTLRR